MENLMLEKIFLRKDITLTRNRVIVVYKNEQRDLYGVSFRKNYLFII